MVGEGVLAAIAFYLGLYERRLVEVLAFFLVFVHPQFGEHVGYLEGHEPGEDGVAGILRSSGEDAAVEVFLDVEHVADFLGEHTPLVVAEVVDDDEKYLLAVADGGEHAVGHDAVRHQRPLGL